MNCKLRALSFLGLVAFAVSGCRAPASTTEQSLPTPSAMLPPPVAAQSPPPVAEGSYSLPPFESGTAAATASPPPLTQVASPAPCTDAPPPKRGWRSWLPTKDHSNDPTRERGQFTDGWYEPEYRGLSD